jgi:transposase-like protein
MTRKGWWLLSMWDAAQPKARDDLSRATGLHVRRLINQAFFKRLLIDDESVTGVEFHEPFATLADLQREFFVGIAPECLPEKGPASATKRKRTALSGGSSDDSQFGVHSGNLSNSGHLVGLLALYWKKGKEADHLWKIVSRKPTRENKETTNSIPHRAKQLNEDELEQAETLYAAGASIVDLAKKFGVHRRTLSERLHARGVSIRDTSIDHDSLQVAKRMYEGGSSLVAVCKIVGYSPNTIRTHLLRAGVVIRSRGGLSDL